MTTAKAYGDFFLNENPKNVISHSKQMVFFIKKISEHSSQPEVGNVHDNNNNKCNNCKYTLIIRE